MLPTVAIARILEYESTLLDSATALILEEAGFKPGLGTRVLVKPNLVSAKNARNCCTNALVVRAACLYLLDCGARVTVADSPAFGPASHVARAAGMTKALAPMGIKVTSLGRSTPLKLTQGGTIGMSRDALETDAILNMPKLKVHCQMTMSGAVKNLFGCVVGFRKALAHNKIGHSHEVFRSMLMDVYQALPAACHLMDGIRPLHKDGPIGGDPFELGWLAASTNGVALDTATYHLLGLKPDEVPLWAEALDRNMVGMDPAEIGYPLEKPGLFKTEGFTPSVVRDLEFDPVRLVKGRLKSLFGHIIKQS